MSEENLLIILPTGVVSKNFMGEASTLLKIVLCILLDALRVTCKSNTT